MTTDRTVLIAALNCSRTTAYPTGASDPNWNLVTILPFMHFTEEEKRAGWPDAFTIERLAAIQYPRTNKEKEQESRRRRTALTTAMQAAIEGGTLQAEERREMRPVYKYKEVPNWEAPRHMWREGYFPPMVEKRIQEGEKEVTFHVIGRAAFRDFLAACDIEPSEHVHAWLRPLEETGKVPAPAIETEAGRTPVKRAALIVALGRRYPALESALKRGDKWIAACKVPERRGWYWLEAVEEECRVRYGETRPVSVRHDGSAAGQLRSISGK